MAISNGTRFTSLVIILRTVALTLKSVRLSIMDCPARVPVIEEEMPAQRSATAKTSAASEPKSGCKVACASSNVATFILAWTVSRILTKKRMLEEQAQLETKKQNTAMWMSFIKDQGGQDE